MTNPHSAPDASPDISPFGPVASPSASSPSVPAGVAYGVIRGVLVALGGVLVAHKIIDEESLQQLVGGLLVVVPIIYSAFAKWWAEAKTQARETIALQAGVEAVRQGKLPDSTPTEAIGAKHAQMLIQDAKTQESGT